MPPTTRRPSTTKSPSDSAAPDTSQYWSAAGQGAVPHPVRAVGPPESPPPTPAGTGTGGWWDASNPPRWCGLVPESPRGCPDRPPPSAMGESTLGHRSTPVTP
jgi:hypothetical protein